MRYSDSLTGGWSDAEVVYNLAVPADTYSYAFHANHNVDPTGKKFPLTWTSYTSPAGYLTALAMATFS